MFVFPLVAKRLNAPDQAHPHNSGELTSSVVLIGYLALGFKRQPSIFKE